MTPAAGGYARALLKSAEDLDCAAAVADELQAMEAILSGNSDYFNNPEIAVQGKAQLLRAVFSGKVSPLTTEFVILLLERRMFKRLPDIAARYKQLCDVALCRAAVNLRVPFMPDAPTLDRLKARLVGFGLIPKSSAGNVSFQITLDEELIGGFIADCGGYRVDTSLNSAVGRLRRPERL